MAKTTRRAPRPPFLLTVAAASIAFAPACGGVFESKSGDCPTETPSVGSACDTDGAQCSYSDTGCSTERRCHGAEWVDESPPCNPPPPTCPDTAPFTGDACDFFVTCEYFEQDECGWDHGVTATCDGSVWSTGYVGPTVSCNPPPPCPDELPEAGSNCWVDEVCHFKADLGCGVEAVEASCDAQGNWQIVSDGTCNPPPPCSFYGTEENCGFDPACAWLVPGCGEPALAAAGCFEAEGCSSSLECPDGQSCTTVWTDPCWNQACNACGEQVKVCQPAADE